MSEEMRGHLEMLAQRRALWLENIGRDLRFAVRSLDARQGLRPRWS